MSTRQYRRLNQAITELLEPRRMFADVPRELVDVLHQGLWDVAYDAARGQTNELVKQGMAKVDSESRVETYLYGSPPSRLFTELQDLGGVKVNASDVDTVGNRVDAWIPAVEVDEAAALPGVTEAALPDYGFVNETSAGDAILKADQVRSIFTTPVLPANINGTGIKVGVISDGANGAATVAGELGNYTINPSSPGSGNEGTAMMEIVHDLAPGAQLFFSSGIAGSVQMVNSINYLQQQGCNVIVDDVSFFQEGYFQDTSVAQAAASAVSSGVVYVTSAGNLGDQEHYQAIFNGNVPGFKGGNSRLLNFNGLNSPNDGITIPSGGQVIINLQWSDQMGTSGNDYNLYLSDNSFSLVKSSTFVQNGNDNPYEQIVYTNPGAASTFYINVEKGLNAANREIEMTVYGNSSMQYQTQTDELTGQEAVPSVMVVAAENAGSSSIASYSSRGGSTIYTDFVNQISTVRQSLDGTATDGVKTAIGPTWGHQPFYGTSAAAPHAAAIAALIKQVNPSLTPAQIVQIMADTATDITTNGLPLGYDTTSGAGLYNALDAVYKAYVPLTPDLDAASDSGVSNTDNITNINNPSFSGTVPAGSFVSLNVDGVSNHVVQLSANATNYDLSTTSLSNGPHVITIKVASSNLVPSSNLSNASAPLNVTIDISPPPAPTTPDLIAASDSGSSSIDNVTNINIPTFNGMAEAGATITLLVNGVAKGTISSNGQYNVAPTLAMADGSYSITTQAMDTAGNMSVVSTALNPVKIDTVAPTISTPVYNPNLAAMTVKVGFSEDVSASLNNGSLKVQNIHTSQLLPAAQQSYSFDAVNKIASFTFVPGFPTHGILPDGDYNAAMYGTNVTDLAGNHPALDGSLNFFFMQADANFDRTVNALDFNAIAANFGGAGKTYAQGDYNYDGSVSTPDFTILASKFNQILPMPASLPQNVMAATPGSLFADGKPIDDSGLGNLLV